MDGTRADKELEAVLKMNQATRLVMILEKAFRRFHSPAQNFVFQPTDGTIAYKANGRIPEFGKKGRGSCRYQVILLIMGGVVYVELMITRVSSTREEGFIATANNEITEDSYPYHISKYWAQPYRYERIAEVLREREMILHQKI